MALPFNCSRSTRRRAGDGKRRDSYQFTGPRGLEMNFRNLSPAFIIVTVISLALAPFVAVMVTSFTKIVVVLSLLRNALGTQQVPPNVVVNGLAIILSIYVMYPVMLDSYNAVDQRAAVV